MPAESRAQQRLMGACMHGAGWASCPKMTQAQFRGFAETKHKGLPERVKAKHGATSIGKNYSRGTASATLGNETPLPKSIYGSDIIPAALTPKEMVLDEKQQSAVMPIPGMEHKLKPSQVKKLHAMKRNNLRLPIPRMKFRFGTAAVGGPKGMTTYQAGVNPHLTGEGFNPDWQDFQDLTNLTDNPAANSFFRMLAGYGTFPGIGNPISGGTQVPTFWRDQGGGITAPLPIPIAGWSPDPSQQGLPNPHVIRAKVES